MANPIPQHSVAKKICQKTDRRGSRFKKAKHFQHCDEKDFEILTQFLQKGLLQIIPYYLNKTLNRKNEKVNSYGCIRCNQYFFIS